MIKILSSIIFMFTMSTSVAAAAQAENCEHIRFQSGAYSQTVHGIAPPDDVICYEITTRAGQTADITVTGNNVIFSIGGVIDAQDSYSFTTEKRTYQIFVGQLMRSVTNQPFELMVSIK